MQAAHKHGMVRHSLAQQLLVRIVVGPCAFIPAESKDPFAFCYGLRPRGDEFDSVGLGFSVDEADPVNLFA
jgi:hypothetical protein